MDASPYEHHGINAIVDKINGSINSNRADVGRYPRHSPQDGTHRGRSPTERERMSMERDPSPHHPVDPPRPIIVIQEPTPPESIGRKQTSKHEEDKLKEPRKVSRRRKDQHYDTAAEATHQFVTENDSSKKSKGDKKNIDEANIKEADNDDQKPRRRLRYHITHQHHYHIHHHHYHTNYLPGSDVPQRRSSEPKHQWYAPPPAERDMHGYVQLPGHQGVHVLSKDPNEQRAEKQKRRHMAQKQDGDKKAEGPHEVPKPEKLNKGSRRRATTSRAEAETAPIVPPTPITKEALKAKTKAEERKTHEGKENQSYRRHQASRSYPTPSKPRSHSRGLERRNTISVPKVADEFDGVSDLAKRRKHRKFGDEDGYKSKGMDTGKKEKGKRVYSRPRSPSVDSLRSVSPVDSASQIGAWGERKGKGSQSKLRSKMRK
ncbi:hypothetical protein F4805DRAFT_452569 [Annulohypoxylon moriforme]|nr:hypothetical protein F4805DRAFT_452569 [Annulohypoxylon moriforme]